MTALSDVDMKSDLPAELETEKTEKTEKTSDIATDLEAASSTAELSRSYCWHSGILCINILILLLQIAEEV